MPLVIAIASLLLIPISLTGNVISEPSDVWISLSDENYLHGDALFSNSIGASLNYSFTGDSVTIITQKRDDFGIMEVNLDGEISTYNLYSKDNKYEEKIEIPCTYGKHDLIISVSADKDERSSGNYIVVDEVIVLSEEIDIQKLHGSLKNIELGKKEKVLVQLKEGASDKLSFKDKKLSRVSSLVFAEIDDEELSTLASSSDVISVWPDLQTESLVFSSAHQVNADYMRNLGRFGAGVKIAILDSGIAAHEVFGSRIAESVDFTGTSTSDVLGHGTHVAGIAVGSIGMANETIIYNVKVLDDNGYGQLSWLINGIDWAIEHDVDVISLSLGAIYSGSAEDQLSSPEVLKVEEAIADGITVVIASGNCGSGHCGSFSCVTTPGIARNAITVGAVDSSNNWASFSSGCVISDFIKPDVVAPGVSIYSSVPNGYDYKTGTSMATPFVSGAVAMMLENNTYTPSQVKQMIESNAMDLGTAGKDVQYGSGLLNLDEILSLNPMPDTYSLNIPLFEVDHSNDISVSYHNTLNESVSVKVEFIIEELDNIFDEDETEVISPDSSHDFILSWHPKVPGKHVLRINIWQDSSLVKEIKTDVNVFNPDYVNRFAGLSVMER